MAGLLATNSITTSQPRRKPARSHSSKPSGYRLTLAPLPDTA
jgi:hypothetical protein